MFYVKESFSIDGDWILSKLGDENVFSIPHEILQKMRNYHLMGVEFLYHNFRKGLKGSILNQDLGMNFPLQIAAFLSAVLKTGTVLIICPESTLCSWHYFLSNCGNFNIAGVNSESDKFLELSKKVQCLVQLVTVSEIYRIEEFLDISFDFIIVDDFDKIATKLIFKKLNGKFNIGLTNRSFYLEPDQKLQWTMLNWSNPGVFGKLRDFYDVDNENFRNLRDSYRFWWSRLTWEFCESFKRPTFLEMRELEDTLTEWAERRNLKFGTAKRTIKKRTTKENDVKVEPKKSRTKVKKPRNEQLSTNRETTRIEEDKEKNKKEINKEEKKKNEKEEKRSETGKQKNENKIKTEIEDEKDCSPKSKQNGNPNYVELPSMDENPILTSIIKNLSSSSPVIPLSPQTASRYDYEPDDVILSIIKTKPSTSKCESDDFIRELASNSSSQQQSCDLNIEDIDRLLKETDALLGRN